MGTIQENLLQLQTVKEDIKTSIENKGITVSNTHGLEDFPSLIRKIGEIDSCSYNVINYLGSKTTSNYNRSNAVGQFGDIIFASGSFSSSKNSGNLQYTQTLKVYFNNPDNKEYDVEMHLYTKDSYGASNATGYSGTAYTNYYKISLPYQSESFTVYLFCIIRLRNSN